MDTLDKPFKQKFTLKKSVNGSMENMTSKIFIIFKLFQKMMEFYCLEIFYSKFLRKIFIKSDFRREKGNGLSFGKEWVTIGIEPLLGRGLFQRAGVYPSCATLGK